MANVFTLDSFREEVKKKFEPVIITMSDGSSVVLKSLLRVPKEQRQVVKDAIKEVQGIDEDAEDNSSLELVVEAISRIFSIIADKPVKLLQELHDDDLMVKISMMSEVLTIWAKETQLGEAPDSPS